MINKEENPIPEQQRVTSVNAEAWRRIKENPRRMMLITFFSGLWVVIVFLLMDRGIVLVENTGLFVVAPISFILIVYFVYMVGQAKKEFWRQFAEGKGLTYAASGDISEEMGIMFHQGNNRTVAHFVQGNFRNVPIRIFNYHFQTGSGKYAVHHVYTVFEFRFTGMFPHLYLNSMRNGYGFTTGEVIPLPSEFEKRFKLYAPKEYEIEALEIFTPDVLAILLEDDLRHDIELVDHELLIFREGEIQTTEALEREFQEAVRLYGHFAPKLNHMHFAEIGDRSPYLKT